MKHYKVTLVNEESEVLDTATIGVAETEEEYQKALDGFGDLDLVYRRSEIRANYGFSMDGDIRLALKSSINADLVEKEQGPDTQAPDNEPRPYCD